MHFPDLEHKEACRNKPGNIPRKALELLAALLTTSKEQSRVGSLPKEPGQFSSKSCLCINREQDMASFIPCSRVVCRSALAAFEVSKQMV